MYELAVKTNFIAQHFLTGGDWGSENVKHSHHYQIEVQLRGKALDQHGFVADIVIVKNQLEKLAAEFRDRTLNELPGFKNINPSIENLARVAYQLLTPESGKAGVVDLTVKVWEDEIAWVAYDGE